jgi:3-hydroxy-9,10-secoandrosta-1,3,5(10)-triene-9,17-dione monooxygenase reductase component
VSETSATTPFDSAKYRQVLGHFPTGVTVITAMTDDGPAGMAIGSFSSLSLDPALVLFSATKTSASWAKLRSAGKFCVNILGDDQEDISRVFGSKAEDKFSEIGWKRSANGAPLITGVLAYIDCDLHTVLDGGDHDIIIGSVTDLDVKHEGGALVFFRGGYGRVAF